MGHVPPPLMPTSAEMFLAWNEERLQREMRGRCSIFGWRRRRAYRACLTLIKARDAVLGYIDDPWELKPPTRSPAEQRLFDLQVELLRADHALPNPMSGSTG